MNIQHHTTTILACLLLVAGACKQGQEPQEAEAPETEAVQLSARAISNAGITTGTAALSSMKELLKVAGIAEVPPRSLVSVSFPMAGILKNSQLLPGSPVRKGQVLATLEDAAFVQLQQDYLQAREKLTLLRLDYERQKALSAESAGSIKIFEQANAEYAMQQVLVRSLEERLRLIGLQPDKLSVDKITRSVAVVSPIDGFVKSVHLNMGKYTSPGEVLFDLIDPRDIHASLTVYEKDLHKLKVGQRVTIYTTARPGIPYQAEVILVSRDIDDNRGATVHCHFVGAHADVYPGMYLSAEVGLDATQQYTVPEEAVVRHGGSEYVFLATGTGQYRMQQVQTGMRSQGRVAIAADGIDWANQQLVLTNAYALLGKMMNTEEEE